MKTTKYFLSLLLLLFVSIAIAKDIPFIANQAITLEVSPQGEEFHLTSSPT